MKLKFLRAQMLGYVHQNVQKAHVVGKRKLTASKIKALIIGQTHQSLKAPEALML